MTWETMLGNYERLRFGDGLYVLWVWLQATTAIHDEWRWSLERRWTIDGDNKTLGTDTAPSEGDAKLEAVRNAKVILTRLAAGGAGVREKVRIEQALKDLEALQ